MAHPTNFVVYCLPGYELLILCINPLNAELNPLYHFLALLGAHPILHVSGVRVKWISQTSNFSC